MRARFDIPVVWLLIALASVGAMADLTVSGWGGAGLRGAAMLLALGSAGLALWAVAVMRAARTAVMPGQVPAALVTSGPFAFSRNPIYLGMAGLVAALALWLGAPLALLVVPAFMAVIAKRFIRAEEQRLASGFGPAFQVWSARVGRWLGPGAVDGNSLLK